MTTFSTPKRWKVASRSASARRCLAIACSLWLITSPVFGATNRATGDIAGDGASLADSELFELNSTGVQLTLVKRAYLSDGTRVPTTSTLPKGSIVDFMVYISNDSTVQINDVSVKDLLDPAFVYQTTSIRVDNSVNACAAAVCTPAEEDNVYSVVEAKTPLTDDVDGDVASYASGTKTIDVGNESVANAPLNIAGERVWAVVFSVSVP